MSDQHDEAEQAQLGLGIVRSLVNLDADQVQHDAIQAYQDGNMRVWQNRSGVAAEGIAGAGPGGKKKMGHTVRISSPEYNLGWVPAAIVSAALLLGATGLGAAWILKGSDQAETPPVPAEVIDTDTDTRSTLRPYTGEEDE